MRWAVDTVTQTGNVMIGHLIRCSISLTKSSSALAFYSTGRKFKPLRSRLSPWKIADSSLDQVIWIWWQAKPNFFFFFWRYRDTYQRNNSSFSINTVAEPETTEETIVTDASDFKESSQLNYTRYQVSQHYEESQYSTQPRFQFQHGGAEENSTILGAGPSRTLDAIWEDLIRPLCDTFLGRSGSHRLRSVVRVHPSRPLTACRPSTLNARCRHSDRDYSSGKYFSHGLAQTMAGHHRSLEGVLQLQSQLSHILRVVQKVSVRGWDLTVLGGLSLIVAISITITYKYMTGHAPDGIMNLDHDRLVGGEIGDPTKKHHINRFMAFSSLKSQLLERLSEITEVLPFSQPNAPIESILPKSKLTAKKDEGMDLMLWLFYSSLLMPNAKCFTPNLYYLVWLRNIPGKPALGILVAA